VLRRVIRSLIPQSISISPDQLAHRPVWLKTQLSVSAKIRLLEKDTQAWTSQTSLSHLPKSLEDRPGEEGRISSSSTRALV
jgi:hypothetical protein